METNGSDRQRGENKWRYSVGGGLLAVLSTTISYWQTGSEISFTLVALIAFVVGYAARRRSAYGDGIGTRVGVIGGLPVLWESYGLMWYILGLSNPPWFSAVSLVLLAGFTVALLGVSALFGEGGARVGRWLADRSDRSRPVSHNHQ